MKITHIFWSLGYGGIETMLVNISNEQSLLGAEVSIIILNDLISEELLAKIKPNVSFVGIGRRLGSKNLSFISVLNSKLDDIKPNIIHLHSSVLYNYISRRWRNSHSCCICCTLHDMPFGICGMPLRLGRFVQNLLFGLGGIVMNINRVDGVFAISNSVAVALKTKYGVDSTVICNGIKVDKFKKRALIKPVKEFKIVQVSRLVHEKKGQDLLIRAINKLIEREINFHVSFIGDGESRDYLERMVEEYGIKDRIDFLGTKSQDYLLEHLSDYDLFVQPSRYEGFGLTVAEAMAACVPVLVSSGQGPAEVTNNDTFGWVFDSGNVDSLSRTIANIQINYDVALQKSIRAYHHVKENYDVSITAKKYMNNYELLLNSKQ